eukprot:SAG31_NODE_15736_length_740_cov_2.923557_1_plen_173_part_00
MYVCFLKNKYPVPPDRRARAPPPPAPGRILPTLPVSNAIHVYHHLHLNLGVPIPDTPVGADRRAVIFSLVSIFWRTLPLVRLLYVSIYLSADPADHHAARSIDPPRALSGLDRSEFSTTIFWYIQAGLKSSRPPGDSELLPQLVLVPTSGAAGGRRLVQHVQHRATCRVTAV